MCKVGDIILVHDYISNGVPLQKHSFIVIDDHNGEIRGLEYDWICNVLSSIKNIFIYIINMLFVSCSKNMLARSVCDKK